MAAPSAPTSLTATPASSDAGILLLSWTEPTSDGGKPITGYRVRYADNSGMTSPYSADYTIPTGGVALAGGLAVIGIPAGAWWLQVAALNADTAGGATPNYSTAASATVTPTVGDVDGWSAFGVSSPLASLSAGGGARRALVTPLGTPTSGTASVSGTLRRALRLDFGAPACLMLEVQRSGSGSVAIGAAGIKRTFTGLTVGMTYRLSGKMRGLRAAAPYATGLRFAVVGVGNGSTGSVAASGTEVTIPTYEFVATSTSHEVRIETTQALTWTGSGLFTAAAFYSLALSELPAAAAYRLQDVGLEASLADHFTIACDTAGAAWWVGADDVTRFRQAADTPGPAAIFTDTRTPGELEYSDIQVSYDTRNVVNRLAATNHGRDATSGAATSIDYAVADSASVDAWGARKGEIEMSLRSGFVDLENLILNPSGETNATNWAAGTGTSAVAQSTTVGAVFGTQAIRATCSAASSNVIPSASGVFLPVVAGRSYTFSVYIRSQVARSATLNIQWWNATSGGSLISTSTSSAVTTLTGGWQRHTVTATAPAGALGAYPFVQTTGNSAGQFHYFDGAMFTEGALVDYFDGTTAATADYVYEWSGTAHASTARRRTFALLNARLAAILARLKTPVVRVTSITWNAQQDTATAAAIDVQGVVRVRFNGVTNDYRVIGIKHSIGAARWIVTYTLDPL